MKIFDWLDGIEVTVFAVLAALLLVLGPCSSRIGLRWLTATLRHSSRVDSGFVASQLASVTFAVSG